MASCVVGGTALAQPALDEPAPGESPATPEPATTTTSSDTPADPNAVLNPDEEVKYGVGIRLRNVRVPRAILELFLERAGGGASTAGFGAEFIRRRGTVELQFAIEYDSLQVGQGVWIESGDDVAAGAEADYVLKPSQNPDDQGLGWVTFEFTFLNHAKINKYVAIRYGGGAGLGIITGGLWKYDVNSCRAGATNDNPEPGCVPTVIDPNGTGDYVNTPTKYDLPPVFPVINGIIGVQFTPIENLVINLEGGIRTTPFWGASVAYFF